MSNVSCYIILSHPIDCLVECHSPANYRQLLSYPPAEEEEEEDLPLECTLEVELEPFKCVERCEDTGFDPVPSLEDTCFGKIARSGVVLFCHKTLILTGSLDPLKLQSLDPLKLQTH